MSDLMKRAKRWEKFHEPIKQANSGRFLMDNVWKGLGAYLDYEDRQRSHTREDERLAAYKQSAADANADRDESREFAREQFEYGQGRDKLNDTRQLLLDSEAALDRSRARRFEDEDRGFAAKDRIAREADRLSGNKRADEYLDIQRQNLDLNEGSSMLEAAERRARGQREGEAHSLQMETAKSELERQEQGRRANAKNARRLLKHPRYGDIARQSLPPDFDPDTADDFEITDVMERYVLPEIRSAMETQEKIAVEREKGRGQFLEKSLQEERDIIGAMRKDRAAADEFGSLASSYLDEQGNLRPDYDAEDAVADPALLASLGEDYAGAELRYRDVPRLVRARRERLAGGEANLVGLRRSRDEALQRYEGPGSRGVGAAQQSLQDDEAGTDSGGQPDPEGSPNAPNNMPTQNVTTQSYTPRRERRRAYGRQAAENVDDLYSQSVGGERRDPAVVGEMVATGVLSPGEMQGYIGEQPNMLGFESEPQRAAGRIRGAAEGARGVRGVGRTPIEIDDEVNAAYPRSLFGMETPLGERVRLAQSGDVVGRLNQLAMEPGYSGARAIDNPNRGMLETAALLADQLEPADLERLHPSARRLVELAQRSAGAR